ncbi:hypothetical protein BG000_000302 [Podila horticola]|nr:hypothetical protein BG000_000302 [Podila horticola]
MPATSQKFKFSSSEIELDPVSSTVPCQPPFIYIDDVLEAFKIPDVVKCEADGRTIAYAQDGNGSMYHPKRIPCRPGCMIQVFYKSPQSIPNSLESKITPGSLVSLNGSADQLGIKSNVLTDFDLQELQKQMNNQLILIQSKTEVILTEAILTQQLELAEYPMPRLFIVLPKELPKYDPGDGFRTKFRLHFICECGEYTEETGDKIPNHFHLAKHEGYVISRPTEFFSKYGPFLMLMLELIKFGTSIASHVVPTLASIKVVKLADSVKHTVELAMAKIDYSLEFIKGNCQKVQHHLQRISSTLSLKWQ